jgi:hypothetical protein
MMMTLGFEQHEDTFVVWPALYLTCGKCSSPDCDATHLRISLGWLIWTVQWGCAW